MKKKKRKKRKMENSVWHDMLLNCSKRIYCSIEKSRAKFIIEVKKIVINKILMGFWPLFNKNYCYRMVILFSGRRNLNDLIKGSNWSIGRLKNSKELFRRIEESVWTANIDKDQLVPLFENISDFNRKVCSIYETTDS